MMGQMDYVRARELSRKEDASQEKAKDTYRRAVKEWTRLVDKYPDGREPSLAQFRVREFTLKKLQLTLKPEREVYFRGEKVEVTAKAEYNWGQPATDRVVRYTLPDGRHFVDRTDEDGELPSPTTPPEPCRAPVLSSARACRVKT